MSVQTLSRKASTRRIFIDMDGVIAEFRHEADYAELFKKGYFITLMPNENILKAVKELIKTESVYVLSSVIMESPFALEEKKRWLDKNLPEVDSEHRIFPPYSYKTDKTDYIPDGVHPSDILLDDFGKNIRDWKGKAVKVSKSQKDRTEEMTKYKYVVSPEMSPEEICRVITED